MKNLKFIIGAFILFFTLQSTAQVSVSLNIGSRPDWCSRYDNDDDCHHNDHCDHNDVSYFYLPEIEAYYDTHASVFIYLGPRGWIRSAYLPDYCSGYDLYRGHKVAIDYRGRTPYYYHKNHKAKYFHSNYRNYRQEYYNPGPNRRYVASNHRGNHTYYGNKHDRKENHGNNRGHGNRNDRGGDRDDNGRGNGHGNGNGRR